MRSFTSFEQFVRHGAQASIVLRTRAVAPMLEQKQARLEGSVVDAFRQQLRDLAAENWSDIAAALASG